MINDLVNVLIIQLEINLRENYRISKRKIQNCKINFAAENFPEIAKSVFMKFTKRMKRQNPVLGITGTVVPENHL